jgi:hypothetical protein
VECYTDELCVLREKSVTEFGIRNVELFIARDQFVGKDVLFDALV